MPNKMHKSMVRIGSLAILIVAVAVSASRADDGPQRPRPPQAAFDACQSKSAGDTCEVAMPDRTVGGKCAATPDGTLACRPDHPPGPPPELTRACEGKNDGDACVVTHHEHQEDGVCRKGRSGTLICLP